MQITIKEAKWQNDKQSYKDKIEESKDLQEELQRKVQKLNR